MTTLEQLAKRLVDDFQAGKLSASDLTWFIERLGKEIYGADWEMWK